MPDSDLELAILRLAWRLDALDGWRKDIEQRLGKFDAELARLVKADEIAEAVAAKMNETQAQRLTKGSYRLTERQTWAAISAVCLTAVGLVLNALAQAGVL